MLCNVAVLLCSYLTPHSDSSVMFANCNNEIKTSLQALKLIECHSIKLMWLLLIFSL